MLVTGASGGVATAAIQIAKLSGARVYAVTSGTKNVDRVKALGADVAYDRLEVDFSEEVWRDTKKRGVDIVLGLGGRAGVGVVSASPGRGRATGFLRGNRWPHGGERRAHHLLEAAVDPGEHHGATRGLPTCHGAGLRRGSSRR